jgi:hypothetical protein
MTKFYKVGPVAQAIAATYSKLNFDIGEEINARRLRNFAQQSIGTERNTSGPSLFSETQAAFLCTMVAFVAVREMQPWRLKRIEHFLREVDYRDPDSFEAVYSGIKNKRGFEANNPKTFIFLQIAEYGGGEAATSVFASFDGNEIAKVMKLNKVGFVTRFLVNEMLEIFSDEIAKVKSVEGAE